MSKTIDERVLSMRIDNDQFEQGVEQSTKSLKKLDQALNFQNSSASRDYFEKLQSSANKLNDVKFDGLLGSVRNLGSAIMKSMQDFGVFNIGRQLEQMLESSVKALTIQGPMQGWSAYETSVESAQKIVNATGMELDIVTPKLEKLRWFSDETSYSFETMANTLGDFLANGTDLDQSVNAMMGIANAAGYSGVNAEKASHAMTGFSKAIGRGYMDRMNWSWIRTAGMNTMKFKDQLIEAAAATGTLQKGTDGLYRTVKGTIVNGETFEANLAEQWLSKDALMKALSQYGETTDKIYDEFQKHGGSKETRQIVEEFGGMAEYADDLGLKAFRASQETKTLKDSVEALKTAVRSKWGQTWEIIFGNYEEARALWSNFVEEMWGVFVAPNDVRNEVLKFWKQFEGRESLFQGFRNIWEGILGIFTKLREPFAKIFGWDDDNYTKRMGQFLADLTKDFESMTRSFRDAFVPLDELEDEFGEVADAASSVVEPVVMTAEALDELAKAVLRGDYGNGAERIEKLGQNFKIVQNRVNELLGCSFRYADAEVAIAEGANEASDATGDLADEAEETASRIDKYADILFGLQKAMEIVTIAVSGFFSLTLTLANYALRIVAYAFNKLIDGLAALGRWFRKMTVNAAKGKNVIENFREEVRNARVTIEEFGEKTAKVLSNFFDNEFVPMVVDAFKAITRFFSNTFWPFVVEVASVLKEFFGYLLKGTGIPMLLTSLKNLATVVGTVLFNGITKLFEKVKEFFGLLTKKGTTDDVTRSMEDNRSMAEKLAGVVDDLFTGISKLIDYLANNIGNIGNFFGLFGGQNLKNVETMAYTIDSTLTKTIGDGSAVSRGIGTISNHLGILSGVIGNLSSYKTKWGSFVDGLTAFGSDQVGAEQFVTLIKSIAQIGVGAIMLKIGVGMSQAAKGIGDFAQALGKGAVDLLGNFGGTLKAYENKINAQSLLNVAKAVGILTLSLIGLSMIPADALTNAANLLTQVLLVVALIVKFYSAIKKADKITNNTETNMLNNNVITVVSDTILSPLGVAIQSFGKSVAQGVKEAFRLPGLAVLLLSFATSILIVFNVLEKMVNLVKNTNGEEMKYAFINLAAIFGGLLVGMIILTALVKEVSTRKFEMDKSIEKASSKASGSGGKSGESNQKRNNKLTSFLEGTTKDFLGAAIAIIALAYALKLVIESAKEIIKINKENTFQELGLAILEVVVLMVGIGAAVGLAGAGGFAGIISFAVALYALASFLPSIIQTLKGFEEIPWDSIWKTLSLIGALALGLLAFSTILTRAKIDWKTVAVLSVGIVALALAMSFMADNKVAQGISNFINAALGLALALGILAVLDFFAGEQLEHILILLASSMASIGIGAIAFSVGLYIAAAALEKFGVALGALGAGIKTLGEFAKGHIWTTIAVLALLAAGMFVIYKVAGPIASIFGALAEKIKGLGSASKEGEGGIKNFFTKIPSLIANFTKMLGVAAIVAAPGVVDFLIKLVVTILENLAKAITANGATIITAIWHVIVAILGLFVQAIGMAFDGIGKWLFGGENMFTNWVSDVMDWFGKLFNKDDNGKGPIRDWFDSLFPKKGDLKKNADESFKELQNEEEYLRELKENGGYKVNRNKTTGSQAGRVNYRVDSSITLEDPAETYVHSTAGKFIETAEDVAPETSENVIDIFTNYLNQYASENGLSTDGALSMLGLDDISSIDFQNMSLENIESMFSGFTSPETLASAGDSVDTITDAMIGQANVRTEDFETIANVQGVAYANQFMQSKTQAGNAAQIVCKAMLDAIEDHYSSFYNSGKSAGIQLMNGIEKGIDDHMKIVTDKIDELAKKMDDALKTAEKISSPSRVWEGFGRFMMMGLANGLTKYTYLATDAVMNMVTSVNSVGDAIGSDLESAPTIRPVLDFTDVSYGSKQISTMFDAERVNLTAQAMELNNQGTQMDQLLNIATKMYRELQNGQDLYLDDNILAGRINRRLGMV